MAKAAKETPAAPAAQPAAADLPEHLRRTYNIKKYHGKGRDYHAKALDTVEDAKAELTRLADKLKKKGLVPSMADDGMSFTVNEGTKEKPAVAEYKIL